MRDTEDFSPQRVADRMEIQHRVYQFCQAVDRMDVESARSAFHPDAYDDHGLCKGGVDDLFAWIRGRHANLQFSYHHVGNIYIEFAGPDDAVVDSYVLTWQSTAPAGADGSRGPEMFAAGRYVDHFTRRDGHWRIQRRASFPESAMEVVPPANMAMLSDPAWAHGSRDENDPVQVLRRELGMIE